MFFLPVFYRSISGLGFSHVLLGGYMLVENAIPQGSWLASCCRARHSTLHHRPAGLITPLHLDHPTFPSDRVFGDGYHRRLLRRERTPHVPGLRQGWSSASIRSTDDRQMGGYRVWGVWDWVGWGLRRGAIYPTSLAERACGARSVKG